MSYFIKLKNPNFSSLLFEYMNLWNMSFSRMDYGIRIPLKKYTYPFTVNHIDSHFTISMYGNENKHENETETKNIKLLQIHEKLIDSDSYRNESDSIYMDSICGTYFLGVLWKGGHVFGKSGYIYSGNINKNGATLIKTMSDEKYFNIRNQ